MYPDTNCCYLTKEGLLRKIVVNVSFPVTGLHDLVHQKTPPYKALETVKALMSCTITSKVDGLLV